jgi:hypothetical protein
MPVSRAVDPASMLAAFAVFAVILAIHIPLALRAMADLRENRGVEPSARRTWSIVITLVGIVGPLAWFAFGRDQA